MITAFDMNWEIQPIRRTAITRKIAPVTRATAETSDVAAAVSVTPVRMTALPATAERAELGPVESCLEVPNRAYRIVPAAAAYSPFSIGTLAMPA